MTADAEEPKPTKYVFRGQGFAELPDELVIPLPRSYGLSPTAPQHDELRLREPTEKEFRTEASKSRSHLIAKICGMPVELVEQLPVSIVNSAEAYLLFFVNADQWTETPAS
jgi:hypothetical protein